MPLKDDLRNLSNSIPRIRQRLATEESSKQALVLPFINALGYNIFDPHEVLAEYVADYGLKQGEKVDYAILDDDVPIILIECKKLSDTLNGTSRTSQLFRYFVTTKARFAILTNGVRYKFFSDLDDLNVMDSAPFYELDMTSITDSDIEFLGKFVKGFDLHNTLKAASQIRCIMMIKDVLTTQLTQPDADFIQWLRRQVYPGKMSAAVNEQFPMLVQRGFQEFVQGRIHSTLRMAESPSQMEYGQNEDAVAYPIEEAGASVAELYHIDHPKAPRQLRSGEVKKLIPGNAIIRIDNPEMCATDAKHPTAGVWWGQLQDGDTVAEALSRPGYRRAWICHRIKEGRLRLEPGDPNYEAAVGENKDSFTLLSSAVSGSNGGATSAEIDATYEILRDILGDVIDLDKMAVSGVNKYCVAHLAGRRKEAWWVIRASYRKEQANWHIELPVFGDNDKYAWKKTTHQIESPQDIYQFRQEIVGALEKMTA